MSANDGGPAFPVECTWAGGVPQSGIQTGNSAGWATGMSLRDYFAGQIAVGLVTFANGERLRTIFGDRDAVKTPHEYFASTAYALADAMLSERAK